MFDGLSSSHIEFLRHESPDIVAEYVRRLPQDGPGNFVSFLKSIVTVVDEALRITPENPRDAPEMEVFASNGSVMANITAVKV